jgi:hypothetical protein
VIHPHSHAYRQISAKMFIELLPRSIKRRSTHHIRFVPLDFHWQRMHDVEREITDQNKIKITVPKLVGNFFLTWSTHSAHYRALASPSASPFESAQRLTFRPITLSLQDLTDVFITSFVKNYNHRFSLRAS